VLADLRYFGQGSELTVPVPGGRFGPGTVDALRRAFAAEYTATYGYASEEPLELVNLRLVATGRRPHRLDVARVTASSGHGVTAAGRRPVHFTRGDGPVDTPVVGREAVGAAPVPGPLVVESYDSTVVVPPGAAVHADPQGILVIELGA
jgi:N-methylhydantoinase A